MNIQENGKQPISYNSGFVKILCVHRFPIIYKQKVEFQGRTQIKKPLNYPKGNILIH
jgi:hypothetical protein